MGYPLGVPGRGALGTSEDGVFSSLVHGPNGHPRSRKELGFFVATRNLQ